MLLMLDYCYLKCGVGSTLFENALINIHFIESGWAILKFRDKGMFSRY